jgi:hypothetical protein
VLHTLGLVDSVWLSAATDHCPEDLAGLSCTTGSLAGVSSVKSVRESQLTECEFFGSKANLSSRRRLPRLLMVA